MNAATAQDTPRVWVGCLACYNAGRLVGGWFDGVEAGEIDPDIFGRACSSLNGHEELWVMDHEGYGGLLSGECSPSEAQRLAEILDGLDDVRAPFAAWVASGSGDVDDVDRFAEAYQGEHGTFGEYAHQLADDIGLLDGASETIALYFNWSAWTRDLLLGGDYFTVDAPGGLVWVFDNHA